jgi:hypothetical protein
MKFTVAAVLAFATAVVAHPSNNGTQLETKTITSTEIYCPESTTLTYGTKTITVTKPTTVTITDCPITVVVPITTKTVVDCPKCHHNATTTPPVIKTPTGTGSVTPTKPPPVQAGAGKLAVGGAAFAGVLGFAALL